MAELTALSSRKGRAIATFLNFYVSHGSATRFLRNGEKYYIYFIDNLLLFITVKEFSKSVNSWWWSYRKKFDSAFFSETQCICHEAVRCEKYTFCSVPLPGEIWKYALVISRISGKPLCCKLCPIALVLLSSPVSCIILMLKCPSTCCRVWVLFYCVVMFSVASVSRL